MGSVANEKERGTAALILSKPASRGAFLGAKLVGIGLTLAISLGLASVASWFYTAILFEPPSALGWLGMTGLLLLTLLVYMALTFLGSTLTRSALAAAAIGVGGLVVLAIAVGPADHRSLHARRAVDPGAWPGRRHRSGAGARPGAGQPGAAGRSGGGFMACLPAPGALMRKRAPALGCRT